MRRSPLRHNLARLRLLLGLSQKEIANEVGYSTRAIQSIELGTLALSESVARRISNATAINPAWLLENNLKAPPISDNFKPFTIEDYIQRCRDRERGVITPTFARELRTMALYNWMRAIFATKDGNVALSQTEKFLERLAQKYGHNRSILPTSRLKIAALRDFNVLRQHADIGARFVTEKYKDVLESEGVWRIQIRMLPRGKKRTTLALQRRRRRRRR
jgi:transcriptional regulator with XRE-family HTH domain